MITFDEIKDAHDALRGIVKRTPLEKSKTFSKMTNSNVYLKLENLQNTGSFKIRGAYNKIRKLSEKEKNRGVVCASAGNHAQGVAYASTLLGVKSTVFMPIHTTPTKVLATKNYGAEVVLKGETYDDAYKEAMKLEKEKGMPFIHAFNDDDIISGQGTIGIEIYEDLKDVDIVVVPIGGGGLISGISIALKHLKPDVKIIGVEAEGADSMKESLKIGSPSTLTSMSTIADGIAVKTPGKLTYDIVKKYVDDIVTVNDEEISKTLYSILQRAKLVVEPAGAVSLAAVLSGKIECKNKNVVALISGGNINLSMLTQIIERGMLQHNFLIRVSIIIPDQPKSLKEVLAVFGNLRANVQSIEHDRYTTSVPVGFVKLLITLQVMGAEQINSIEKELKKRKFKYELLN